jgi:hypothetical protein
MYTSCAASLYDEDDSHQAFEAWRKCKFFLLLSMYAQLRCDGATVSTMNCPPTTFPIPRLPLLASREGGFMFDFSSRNTGDRDRLQSNLQTF